jgi:adenylylsulfate kinase
MSTDPPDIQWHHGTVRRDDRETLLGQKGCVVWLTGLSGSGKSTVAHAVERELIEHGHLAYVLDGDNLRHGLNRDLGFTAEDRAENVRRTGEVAKLIADTGTIVFAALISPSRAERARVREIVGTDRFLEIWVSAPLEICEQRDPKGLYRKARAGEIPNFTGISAPYEEPLDPDLTLDTARDALPHSVARVLDLLHTRELISRGKSKGS